MSTKEERDCAVAGLMRITATIDQLATPNLLLMQRLTTHAQVLMSYSTQQCKRHGRRYVDPAPDEGKPIDILGGRIAHAFTKRDYNTVVALVSVLIDRVFRILRLPMDANGYYKVPVPLPDRKGNYK